MTKLKTEIGRSIRQKKAWNKTTSEWCGSTRSRKKMMWFVCMEVPEIYFLLRWHRNFRGRFWKAESYFFVEVGNLQATQIGEAVEQDSHVHAMELSFFKCVHQVPLSCWRFGGGDMGQDIIRCTKTLKWAKA